MPTTVDRQTITPSGVPLASFFDVPAVSPRQRRYKTCLYTRKENGIHYSIHLTPRVPKRDMPETLRAYGIWDLDSDMPEVIPGVRNADFFHSVAIQDPIFLSLKSKRIIPTSVETLPWSHNTIYLDDESPIERGNGLCSIPEFVPLCNQMFRRSMCMLAAHTYKKFPVREEDMYTKGKEGMPIALSTMRDSILSVYRLRFSCVDGLVSRRTVTTRRASVASMETIKRHCTNCITTRAWQIERGIKEVMDSGATMDSVMRLIYSTCVQLYADTVNKRIVWSSMFVASSSRDLKSYMPGGGFQEAFSMVVKEGVGASSRMQIPQSPTEVLVPLSMGILELLRRQAYGPVFEAFLYDKKNLIKLRDSMLIDSYYSGILLMGKNIVTSMESLPADVAVQEQCRLFTAVAAAHIEASCSLRVVPVALSWGLPMEWLDNHASIERMDAWPCFHLIQDAMQITWALLVACDRCLPWTVVHEQLARVFPCEFIECISPFYGFIRRNARMFSKIVRPQALDRMDEMQAILLRV